MTMSIGKRKRREEDEETDDGGLDEGAMRALFQRAFEAKFTPLDTSKLMPRDEDVEEVEQTSEVDLGDDWSGLSEDDNEVETVQHETSWQSDREAERHERRAFMVGE